MDLTRHYLETVSTDALRKLADEHGLYLPPQLNRRFIISELLDWTGASNDDVSTSQLNLEDETKENDANQVYSSTEITALIRDPMWLFIYWDFHAEELAEFMENPDFETFLLRVHTLSDEEPHKSLDYFDIEIPPTDRSRYAFLSFDDTFNVVELCVRIHGEKTRALAQSNLLCLPRPNLPQNLCVSHSETSTVGELSGLREIKTFHFHNYRQAFRSE